MGAIHPFDWNRMLFGDAPPEFAIEVLGRSLLLYVYMLLVMRLFGKRMKGELSATEIVVIITLSGAISVPMQVPEEGLLVGLILLTCLLLFERGLTWLTMKSRRFELLTQGDAKLLIKDGELQWQQMQKIKITKYQVFAILRQHQVEYLGDVERLYIEAGNGFSLYKKQTESGNGKSLFALDDGLIESDYYSQHSKRIPPENG